MAFTNYTVGDFLIRIKNAKMAGRKTIVARSTKLNTAVANVLKKEGYLNDVSSKDGKLTVTLAIVNKEPVLIDLKIVSTPGMRVYNGADELAAKRGASWYLVSTPKGLMSTKEAIKKHVGGEVLAEIW